MSLFSADTEIDLVTRRDPRQIRGRRFARVRKGYDPDQVRDFLDEVATWLEQLESELLSAQEEAESIARRPAPDPYAQLGSHVAELMRGAQEHATRVRREADEESSKQLAGAKQRSEEIRSEAQTQAKRIRMEAQDDAERLRREADEEGAQLRAEANAALERARAETEATLAGLAGERQRLLSEIRGARHRLASALTRLDEVLDEDAELPTSEENADHTAFILDAAAPAEVAEEPLEGGQEGATPPPSGLETAAPSAIESHPGNDRPASLLGLDAAADGPEDPFEWPELPPDPWEFTAELDRQLFGGFEGSGEEKAPEPQSASMFDEAEFDPGDIDIQIPDIPLIDDRPNPDER
jgi:DivIVA domain-containing protein